MENNEIHPQWDLSNIESKKKNLLMYSTQAVEDMAKEFGFEYILRQMAEILYSGSVYESLTLERKNGHAWKVSHELGLFSVKFICPGRDGDHSDACDPPGGLSNEDVDFLMGQDFDS